MSAKLAAVLLSGMLLFLAVPGLAAAATVGEPSADLETVTAELVENVKDLRRNINSWVKIAADTSLAPAEKKHWQAKAQDYLRECQAYGALLQRLEAKKLGDSPAARRFLAERQVFQRELQFFESILPNAGSKGQDR